MIKKSKNINLKKLKNSALHSNEVSNKVSDIAKIAEIRKVLLPIQRKLIFECKYQIVLVGGRDICSTILPGAFSDLKLYINAKVKTRAARRYQELKSKKIAKNIDFKQILKALKARDLADKTRKTSPLKKTKDSILIDNNSNDISRALKKIVFLIEREIKNISGNK